MDFYFLHRPQRPTLKNAKLSGVTEMRKQGAAAMIRLNTRENNNPDNASLHDAQMDSYQLVSPPLQILNIKLPKKATTVAVGNAGCSDTCFSNRFRRTFR